MTGVLPQALKLLGDKYLKYIFKYVVNFWNGTVDYWQWHVGLGGPVPKKGDLSDPNKWRGINV